MIRFEHFTQVKQKYPRHFTGCYGEVKIESVAVLAEATTKLLAIE